MVTLNETDEYQSEFRTSHKVVLFDDIGASKYGLADTKNPWRKVVDFVNNIRKTALNPNVEMKGKVYIEPDLVIITSNLDFTRGAAINQYIPAQDAIFRRFNRIVRVTNHHEVTPVYRAQNETQICGNYHMSTSPRYTEVKVGKGDTSPPLLQPRDEYVAELIPAFREHERDQADFVKRFNAYFDDFPAYFDDFLDISLEENPEMLIAESCVVRDGSILDNHTHIYPNENPIGTTESHKSVILSYATTLPSVPEGHDDSLFYMTLAYYLRRVDWEKYHMSHSWLNGFNCLMLTNNGVILPDHLTSNFELCVSHTVLGIAYDIVLTRHRSESVHLIAESRISKEVMTEELARHLCGRLGTTLGTTDERRLDNIPHMLIPIATSLLKYPLPPREMAPRVYAIFLAYISFVLDRHPKSVLGDQLWIRYRPKFNGEKLEKAIIREGYTLSVILWEHICRGEEFLTIEIPSS